MNRRPTFNARLGARFQASDTIGLGAGFFTDRATQNEVGSTLGSDRVDFYGGTIGVELRTPLSLTKSPTPDALVLSSTLALRYAIGLGEARGIDLDPTVASPPPRTVAVTYHEIIPYIGTGVLF